MVYFYLHALSSFSPIYLPFISGLFWVFTGNLFWIYLSSNTIIFGEILNVFIKKFFKLFLQDEPWALRPNPCSPCNNFMTPIENMESVYNFGFPSGHSQNVGVFCAIIICYFLNCHKKWEIKVILAFAFSLYVGYSRIQLGCHNVIQVGTGLMIGYLLGIYLWKIYLGFSVVICKKNL